MNATAPAGRHTLVRFAWNGCRRLVVRCVGTFRSSTSTRTTPRTTTGSYRNPATHEECDAAPAACTSSLFLTGYIGQSLSGIWCRCVTRLWARDYGAAINIAHNLRYYLLHASWDPAFLSQHERAETASSGANTTGTAPPPSHAHHDHDGSHKRQRKC